jgi:phospholipid/cholesterol/gamma-HCH transport system substrate-binding protein
MNISTEQKAKTGLFVIISIGILLVLFYIIGNQKKIFGRSFTAVAYFRNIAGTKEGNYVRFAGINVGTVESISMVNDTTVQMILSLEKKIHPYIKTDAVASIGSDGLMGDKLIMIAAGSSTTRLKDGGTIQTVNPVDIDKIVNNLTKVSENAAILTTGLSEIVTKINNGEGSIGRLLSDDKLAKKLEGTIDKTTETVGTIKKTATSVNENMEAAKKSVLLRGYFRKKEKRRIKDSIANENKVTQPLQKEN